MAKATLYSPDMRRQISVIVLTCVLFWLGIGDGRAIYGKDKNTEKALNRAAEMFEEIMQVPERALPQQMLGTCRCLLIFPGMMDSQPALAIMTGGHAGSGSMFGFMTCRSGEANEWSTPERIRIVSSSWWQRGAGPVVGLIFLAMTQKATDLLAKGKIKIGKDAVFTPGAVGWASPVAPASPPADFQAWSIRTGVISGLEIERSTLKVDKAVKQSFRMGQPISRGESRFLSAVKMYAAPMSKAPAK